MKIIFNLCVLFCFIINLNLKCQDLNHNIIIDTIHFDLNKPGMSTIELDKEVSDNLQKYKQQVCKSKIVKKQNIVYTEKDISKVPLADKCILSPKLMGYKIQIYYTKDRLSAEKYNEEFKSNFPNINTEIKYIQPDFKILVGDYLTKNSASFYLNKIKKRYRGAFIIPFPVRCRVAI